MVAPIGESPLPTGLECDTGSTAQVALPHTNELSQILNDSYVRAHMITVGLHKTYYRTTYSLAQTLHKKGGGYVDANQ